MTVIAFADDAAVVHLDLHSDDKMLQPCVPRTIGGDICASCRVTAITSVSIALCSPPSMLSLRSTPRSAGPSGMDRGCAQRTLGAYVMAALPA